MIKLEKTNNIDVKNHIYMIMKELFLFASLQQLFK